MREPIDQGAGETFGLQDTGPLLERQVRGDQNAADFVALAKNLEEEFGSGLGKRHVSEFVDDE